MSYQAAVDALGKMSRVMKAFEDAEVVLKALAGVEQNEREMRDALARAKADLEAATADAAESKAAAKTARMDAKKIDAAAQAAAKEIVDAAHEKAAQVHADSLGAVDKARETLRSIKADTEKALADQSAVQEQLNSLNAALAEARQRVSTMLG
jgi:cell division septum initiation protein DivIVA